MKEEDLRKYAAIMKEFSLSVLDIAEEDIAIHLERAEASSVVQGEIKREEITSSVEEGKKTDENLYSMKSPVVGVFYAAPTENTDPYVKTGDRIEKGQIVCIIESMKMLNEIPSEFEGTIEKICVTNGQVVEYGTELFQIRRN